MSINADPEISIPELEETVKILSSANYMGRKFDSAESSRASVWLAGQFDALGLDVPEEGRIHAVGKVENVYGLIRGKDPTETVVVAAHYDHLGLKNNQIYFGADDNASGCAAVLEMARAFITSGIQPERNILFAFFDGEEFGKLGSKQYLSIVDTPHWVAIHEPPVFMLNLDMVGRAVDSKLYVDGVATSPVLKSWVGEAQSQSGKLQLQTSKVPKLNGDHAVFMAYGVPVLRLFTGRHSDYHRPSDTWEKINFQGLKDVTDFAYYIVLQAAIYQQGLRKHVRPTSAMATSAREKVGLNFNQALN